MPDDRERGDELLLERELMYRDPSSEHTGSGAPPFRGRTLTIGGILRAGEVYRGFSTPGYRYLQDQRGISPATCSLRGLSQNRTNRR